MNAWTYAADNGSRLRNYAAPESWERGHELHTLVEGPLGFLLANNLTATPYAVIDPGVLGIGKRSVLAEEGLFFTYTNQYDDRRGDRHFWNVEDHRIRLDDGEWHRLELLIEGVEPGVAGATATMWVDGQQVAQETGLIVFGAATTQPRWDGVGISNPYGGGFARVPRDQWIDYAQVRMSVR